MRLRDTGSSGEFLARNAMSTGDFMLLSSRRNEERLTRIADSLERLNQKMDRLITLVEKQNGVFVNEKCQRRV